MKLQIFLVLIASSNVVISQSIYLNQGLSESILQDNVNQFLGLTNIPFSGTLQDGLSNLNNTAALLNFFGQFWTVIDNLQNINLTENECTHQLKMFADGLKQMDEWAVRMLDAAGKLQPGVLEGNIMQMGHYDECLKIDASVNGSQINGQYCSAFITSSPEELSVKFEMNFAVNGLPSYGFCVPAACNATNLRTLLSSIEEVLHSPIHFVFYEEFCLSTVKPNPISAMTIVSIVFFATIGSIIVLSTLYDILISFSKEKKPIGLLTAFSFYTNGQKLFSVKKLPDSLDCLNGMRVISILWIIGSHRYLYMLMMPLYNLLEVSQWTDSVSSVLITAGNMSVDTFFMISGLLVVYVFMKYSENGQTMSVSMFYLHRILRLTPSLATFILFTATCISHIGSGPFWPAIISILQTPCETKWWSTLLYIQNYLDGEMCVAHAWYLAVDTQLYFISPLLLFPLIKWPKRTIFATFVITLICCFAGFEITWQKELGPAHYGLNDDQMKSLYIPTYVRATPWLVGFITGYIIFYCRKRIIKITKTMVVAMWAFSLSLMIGIVLYHYKVRISIESDLLESSLFNGLSRFLWSLGLSVIIFLCVTGYGGFVNKFLSWSVFTVLIRVNYSMYLLHILVILYSVGQTRTSVYDSVLSNFYLFWGDVGVTLLISIIWTLAFESPIIALEKITFTKKKTSSVPTGLVVLNNDMSVVVVDIKLINSEKLQ